jgi:hypothetical protein
MGAAVFIPNLSYLGKVGFLQFRFGVTVLFGRHDDGCG